MNLYELTDTLPSLNPSSPSSFPSSFHICECYLTGLICQQHPKAFSSLSVCPSHLILPSCCPISANSIEEAVVPVSVEGSLKTWGQIRGQPRCIQVQLLFQPKGLLSKSLHLTLFSCNTPLHKTPVQDRMALWDMVSSEDIPVVFAPAVAFFFIISVWVLFFMYGHCFCCCLWLTTRTTFP